MDPYRKNNVTLWNEWTKIHAASSFYRLEEFKKGENSLNPLELSEVGEVKGRSLLHLQCHFGMDTLSWARLGAKVTGVDFSNQAVSLAQSLSTELNIPACFLCSDIYDLPRYLHEQFDIVFTSYGVLSWLADLPGWAKLVESYLKPGGIFYIVELHPFAMMFDENSQSPTLRYPYFDEQMLACDVQGSYAEPSAHVETMISYEWPYTIGGVVTALAQTGLSIKFLHEFPFTVFPQLAYLKQFEERTWKQPQGYPEIPMLFSIKATKNH